MPCFSKVATAKIRLALVIKFLRLAFSIYFKSSVISVSFKNNICLRLYYAYTLSRIIIRVILFIRSIRINCSVSLQLLTL